MGRVALKIAMACAAMGAISSFAAVARAQYAPVIGNAEIDRFRQLLDMRVRDEQLKRIDGKHYAVAESENKAIRSVQRAIEKKQPAEAASALEAARPIVTSADGQFVLAVLQLQVGALTNDVNLQSRAVDTLLASNATPPTELPMLYRNQGSYAVSTGDLAKAEAAYSKLVEVAPGDAEAFAMLAQTKNEVNKPAEALANLEKAIAIKAGAQQQVPEAWTRAVQILKQNMRVQRPG